MTPKKMNKIALVLEFMAFMFRKEAKEEEERIAQKQNRTKAHRKKVPSPVAAKPDPS